MIIKIKSDNNYLLDILYKNPTTDNGLYFKSLKNGQIVGNAVNKNYYEVVFQDTKYSYLPEDSNQIDYRKDSIVKREIYEGTIKGKYYIEFVLDDRDQVVDMWRQELGLSCFQVNYGSF